MADSWSLLLGLLWWLLFVAAAFKRRAARADDGQVLNVGGAGPRSLFSPRGYL